MPCNPSECDDKTYKLLKGCLHEIPTNRLTSQDVFRAILDNDYTNVDCRLSETAAAMGLNEYGDMTIDQYQRYCASKNDVTYDDVYAPGSNTADSEYVTIPEINFATYQNVQQYKQ